MLLTVEGTKEKQAAQEAMEGAIRSALSNRGTRNIGFPGGNADEVVFANGSGELWAAFGVSGDAAVPRRWNAFGVFDEQRHAQIITVEVNIPTTSNSARVSGFFARDPTTGHVYLMHDGGVGGGKKGVGRNAFLAWTKATLVNVRRDGMDEIRAGIVIGRIDSGDFVSRLWRFVQLVRDFKDAVSRGELDSNDAQTAIEEWESFSGENPGRRRGRRRSMIDYISYHGDVVRRLYEERSARCSEGECIFNSQLIDLYVRRGRSMIEIYEVKTSTDRQSIYTAIGQLICHSIDASPSIRRTLVLPDGPLAPDLDRCLQSLSIHLRRFAISSGKVPEVILW